MSNGLIKRAARERLVWMQPLHCCVHQIMRSPETATVTHTHTHWTEHADGTLTLSLIILSFKPVLRKNTCTQMTFAHTDTHTNIFGNKQTNKKTAQVSLIFPCVLCLEQTALTAVARMATWQHLYKVLTERERDAMFSRNTEPSAGSWFHSREKWDSFFSLSDTVIILVT